MIKKGTDKKDGEMRKMRRSEWSKPVKLVDTMHCCSS